MLATELRHQHVDAGLLAAVEAQMEEGIASEPRCADLPGWVDVLRESTLTPRAELYADTVRACEKLNDAILNVLSGLD